MAMHTHTVVKAELTNTGILLPIELNSTNDQVDPEVFRRKGKGCLCKTV